MFHVGQKVECVDDSDRGYGLQPRVKKGKVYTVCKTGINPHCGSLYLDVVEAPSHSQWGYYQDRFRHLVEKTTDISIFTEMLKPKRVEEPV